MVIEGIPTEVEGAYLYYPKDFTDVRFTAEDLVQKYHNPTDLFAVSPCFV